MLKTLKKELDAAFERIASEFAAEGVTVLMPTFSPPQGRLLSEFNRAADKAAIAGNQANSTVSRKPPPSGRNIDTISYNDMAVPSLKTVSAAPDAISPAPSDRPSSGFNSAEGRAAIAGGKRNTQAFKNVSQFGLDFDTTAYINMFPPGMSEKIVGAIPDKMLEDKKVAVFAFIPPPGLWAQHIADRGLNTEIVASNEQNTRLFFENKGNLMHVLEEAGLGKYVIPTKVVSSLLSEQELRDVYNSVKNDKGKVVVQSCVENYEPTRFIDSEDEFVARIMKAKVPFKVTRFIEGNEANLSFFVGNTLPAEQGRGVAKCNVPTGIDLGNPDSLAAIEAHAAELGIDASNVFCVNGRATLKVVGDELLANQPGDSVGNNIGHVYPDHIGRQITEIGEKLGHKMALCGKVGLAGADLIIDASGKIWINEINDRQQGPTDQMSADAEAAGIPGLSRMAWFAHYADFSKEENLNLLAALRDNADAIHQEYLTSPGSFYIKAFATHDESYDGKTPALIDFAAGIYNVRKQQDGNWSWECAGEDAKMRPIDLASGEITVKISGGSLKKGDSLPSGAEMFRITGTASGNDAPFVIEDGISCLHEEWRKIIETLYTNCFGPGYIEKNPQWEAPEASNDNGKLKAPPKNAVKTFKPV